VIIWRKSLRGGHERPKFKMRAKRDAMMCKIMIVATLALAGIAAAQAAEIPKYRGLWCDSGSGKRYYRCQNATSESYLDIRRNRINLTEESDCRITAVTPGAGGHRLRVSCPSDVAEDPPTFLKLRLDAGGRLHLDQ
jgi:hypothetical protein